MTGAETLGLGDLTLKRPGAGDVVIDVQHSGISTGTEKMFYTGTMPPFPGMGYPLVPGYEAAGEVVEAGAQTPFKPGDHVFVPGADCYDEARGLFGGAAQRLVSAADRIVPIDRAHGAQGALLALAATARHAMAGLDKSPPDLIVGHGVLGRLLARLACIAGGPPPTVWDTDPARRAGAEGYEVLEPATDDRRDYRVIYDASGQADVLDTLMGRVAKGGELVLAGFYGETLSFAFPPAFMKEIRIRVAAEWTRDDLIATRSLVESGALNLDGLISHTARATDATAAYAQAFGDPACLKMILDWKAAA